MTEFCPDGFVADPVLTSPALEVYHRDGIPWHQAPLPAPDHLCEVQTDGWQYITHFQRCACGAHRFPGRSSKWQRRNTRKAP